jgi:hypothetical protein
MTATGLALASARSAFMVTMVIVVVIAMAINATDTLIIVDVGTLGIDSAGLGTVVASSPAAVGVLISYYRPATQFNPRQAVAAEDCRGGG